MKEADEFPKRVGGLDALFDEMQPGKVYQLFQDEDFDTRAGSVAAAAYKYAKAKKLKAKCLLKLKTLNPQK